MKKNQEINFASSQDRKSKSAQRQKGMQIIRCVCGTRILVVPDLKAMNRAIKNHIAEHKKADNDLAPELVGGFLDRADPRTAEAK